MEYFTKIEKVGEGTYGVVYKARHKFTGQLVALKKVRMDTDDGIPSTSIREISLLKELKHPNIVTLDDVLLDNTHLYLVFEFLTMDLRRYMDTLGPGNSIVPSRVKSYMYQINSAILYCHQRGVMHRDLKPHNLLIDKTGIIKVADFGLGRSCTVHAKVYTHEVVTLWYRAPEVLLGSTQYSFPIDVWAMGCIFAEMLSKKPLFRGDSEIDQLFRIFRVLGTPTEAVWPRVSSLPDYKCTFPSWKTVGLEHYMDKQDANAIDLLKRMLIYNPKKRILAKAIEQHPYFGDVKLPRSLKHYYTLSAIKNK